MHVFHSAPPRTSQPSFQKPPPSQNKTWQIQVEGGGNGQKWVTSWSVSLRSESLPSSKKDSKDMEEAEDLGHEFWGFWSLVGQLWWEEPGEATVMALQIQRTGQLGHAGEGDGERRQEKPVARALQPWLLSKAGHPQQAQSLRQLCRAHTSLSSPTQVRPWTLGSG